ARFGGAAKRVWASILDATLGRTGRNLRPNRGPIQRAGFLSLHLERNGPRQLATGLRERGASGDATQSDDCRHRVATLPASLWKTPAGPRVARRSEERRVGKE